jgi:hypothetical protein
MEALNEVEFRVKGGTPVRETANEGRTASYRSDE